MADFQFLRPFWLLLLLLVPLIPWLWRRGRQKGSGWEGVIPHPLLAPLMPTASGQGEGKVRGLWPALLVLIAAIALAGPSWREVPNPLQKQPDSLVVALDLSLSMLATDEAPNRMTRGKQKIRDLLEERADAFTGLVVYAGDAHVVAPLTDDRRAIENLLPAVDPFIMPAMGSRADRAVEVAVELLEQGGRGQGTILLVTDGVRERYHERIAQILSEYDYELRILAVGTAAGAPIPIPDRGFLRDRGEVVTPQLDYDQLQSLAELTGGKVARISLTNEDLKELGVTDTDGAMLGDSETDERRLRLSVDDGYWLLWLLAPLSLLAWRRGGLAVLLLATTLPLPRPAAAFEWVDPWQTSDQQGAELFESDPAQAAEIFSDPQWRGSAYYRSGDYEAAAEQFAKGDSADAHYNRGNALARAGQLEEALAAYDAALALEPDHADALANRALVEELLKQQQKQQQKEQQKKQQKQNQSGGQKNEGQSGQSRGQQPGEPGQPGQQGQRSDSGSGQQPQDQTGPGDDKPGEPGEREQREGDSGQRPGEEGEEDSEAGLLTDPQAQDARSREQWLRRVPDDPGGLLRRKFLYQYQQRPPDNEEESPPW